MHRRRTLNARCGEKWRGDSIPVFRGHPSAQKELEQFLVANYKNCSYEEIGFGMAAMKKHVLTHLTEMRRRISQGHSYLEVMDDPFVCIVSWEQYVCSSLCNFLPQPDKRKRQRQSIKGKQHYMYQEYIHANTYSSRYKLIESCDSVLQCQDLFSTCFTVPNLSLNEQVLVWAQQGSLRGRFHQLTIEASCMYVHYLQICYAMVLFCPFIIIKLWLYSSMLSYELVRYRNSEFFVIKYFCGWDPTTKVSHMNYF